MRIAVTGAFGYSGRYITQQQLEAGHEVITPTNSPHRPNPFGKRFDHRLFTHGQAVANSRAKKEAVQCLRPTCQELKISGNLVGCYHYLPESSERRDALI